MLKKNMTLVIGSIMLLFLLTVLISSPVEAVGSQLDVADDSFVIYGEKVLIVTDIDLGSDKKALGTNKFIQSIISPENIIQLSQTQEHLLRISVYDSQGRLNPSDGPKVAVRIGVINASCQTSTLSNPDNTCWIHPGITGLTNGYNSNNLLSAGNGQCKCVQETGDCYNMTCNTNTIIPGANFGEATDFKIVGLISQQKYCKEHTNCHNGGTPDPTIDNYNGYKEYCNNNVCTGCNATTAGSSSITCHNTTHLRNTTTYTYTNPCPSDSNTKITTTYCGAGKICSSGTCQNEPEEEPETPTTDPSPGKPAPCKTRRTCSADLSKVNIRYCTGGTGSETCSASKVCHNGNCVNPYLTYNEACSNTKQCEGRLECSSSKCKCPTNYDWDSTAERCRLIICKSDSSCGISNPGTTCEPFVGCQLPQGYCDHKYSGGQCIAYNGFPLHYGGYSRYVKLTPLVPNSANTACVSGTPYTHDCNPTNSPGGLACTPNRCSYGDCCSLN